MKAALLLLHVVSSWCLVSATLSKTDAKKSQKAESEVSGSWSACSCMMTGLSLSFTCTLMFRHLQLSCPCWREVSLSQTCNGKTWWRRRRGTVLPSRRHFKDLFLDTSHQWVWNLYTHLCLFSFCWQCCNSWRLDLEMCLNANLPSNCIKHTVGFFFYEMHVVAK